MANHCSNYIELEDITKEQSLVLISWIKSYSTFNYISDWIESIVPKEYLLPDNIGNYGGRWFDIFHYEYDEDYSSFVIQGDSAWSPMTNLIQTLSNYFECEATIEFEEPGNDFGGSCTFSNGKLVKEIDMKYLEWRYFNDGFESIANEVECRENETYFGFLRFLVSSNVKISKEEQQQLKELINGNN